MTSDPINLSELAITYYWIFFFYLIVRNFVASATGGTQEGKDRPLPGKPLLHDVVPLSSSQSVALRDDNKLVEPTGTLNEIREVDPEFSETSFLNTAVSVFETVLDAYARDDDEALKAFCSSAVVFDFKQEIDRRLGKGLCLQLLLVQVRDAVLVGASLDNGLADVTVAFEAELVRSVSSENGTVLEGDQQAIIRTRDLWTFRVPLPFDGRILLVSTQPQ